MEHVLPAEHDAPRPRGKGNVSAFTKSEEVGRGGTSCEAATSDLEAALLALSKAMAEKCNADITPALAAVHADLAGIIDRVKTKDPRDNTPSAERSRSKRPAGTEMPMCRMSYGTTAPTNIFGTHTIPTVIGSPWNPGLMDIEDLPPMMDTGLMGLAAGSDGEEQDAEDGDTVAKQLPFPTPRSLVSRRTRKFVIINVCLLIVFFIAIFSMITWGSPFRGMAVHSDEKTGEVRVSKDKCQYFIQVCMPYWLPTTPESKGWLLLFMFLTMCLSAISLAFLFIMAQLKLVTSFSPEIFDNFQGGGFNYQKWAHSGMVHACIGTSCAWPVCFGFFYKELKGRSTQWMILGFKLWLTFHGAMSLLPFSYVNRAQTNWVVQQHATSFWHFQKSYMVISIVVTIFLSMMDALATTMLCIRWRRFMTRYILDRYLANRAYFMLNSNSGKENGADNPDARIQEDIPVMMHAIINFALAVVDLFVSIITQVAIIIAVVPGFTVFAVVYAVVGSCIGMWFIWNFARLSYEIEKREADWRFSLVNVRTNAEMIAFYGGEAAEKERNFWRFEAMQDIQIRKVYWDMAFAGFMSAYSAGLVLTPSIYMTRMYFRKALDYGGMKQYEGGFVNMCGSLSFVEKNHHSLTNIALCMSRLGGLLDRINNMKDNATILTHEVSDPHIEVSNLVVKTPDARVLISGLTFAVGSSGAPRRLIVFGRSGTGKSSLVRTLAGLWTGGSGEISRPKESEIMFLPQKPYMPLGTLRDQCCYPNVSTFVRGPTGMKVPGGDEPVDDERLYMLLKRLGLGELPDRFPNGFDTMDDWGRILSLGEQQRVSAVRCLLRNPKLVVLDEATSSLSKQDEELVYNLFMELGLPIISIGHRASLIQYHDAVLELHGAGPDDWKLYDAREYEEDPERHAPFD